ncbi:hypothetical protein PsYK624_171860 [Phanerochaete sordida]|uniref:Uncharacterized protein n=1 Tax=Phanerochaete sordida TaxID=48140 RepID=A0A9P3GTA2_9APHY|nr:hypothetical protein PsYK624_171860 [Phanerochaete sordida]
MRSLVCVEHEDWDGTLDAIEHQGGKAGRDWVNDKRKSGFAFQGMCWFHSRIPLDIWQAGEPHSNMIEALHADANREGTGCSLLGGVARGRHLDETKMKSLEVQEATGVDSHYNFRGNTEKALRSLKLQQRSRRKVQATGDADILAANGRLDKTIYSLQRARSRFTATSQLALQRPDSGQVEKARRSVANAQTAYEKALQRSRNLIGTGTGSVKLKWPEFVQGHSEA